MPFLGTDFYDDEKRGHRDIQVEFAEWWVIEPLTSIPNRQAIPDPNRPSYRVKGTFEWFSKVINMKMEEVDVVSRTPKVTFFTCDIVGDLRKSDLLHRCKTGQIFEVNDIEPDGESGTCVHLLQMGVPV